MQIFVNFRCFRHTCGRNSFEQREGFTVKAFSSLDVITGFQ